MKSTRWILWAACLGLDAIVVGLGVTAVFISSFTDPAVVLGTLGAIFTCAGLCIEGIEWLDRHETRMAGRQLLVWQERDRAEAERRALHRQILREAEDGDPEYAASLRRSLEGR